MFFFSAASRRSAAGVALDLFEQHQGTHILQVILNFVQKKKEMVEFTNSIKIYCNFPNNFDL